MAQLILAERADAACLGAVVSGEDPSITLQCRGGAASGTAEGEKKLRNGSVCHSAIYCGTACQEGAWKSHKKGVWRPRWRQLRSNVHGLNVSFMVQLTCMV